MKRETAEKAAKWWGDTISGTHHHDNGAEDNRNLLAMSLADAIAAVNRPTDDQVSKFVDLLTDKLVNTDNISIYCDYHPDLFLLEVAEKVGIDESVFPYKTSMSIRNDVVSVKSGYGSSYIDI